MRNDILERKSDIEQWIVENKSNAFICQQLHCKPETLKKYLQLMDIKYGGNKGGKGTSKPNSRSMKLVEYLTKSNDIQTNKIRKKLLNEGYKKYQCENCGLTEWQGQPIPLEVHHIDGNRFNNSLDNFQLLCPNCHALTESYRGKNSKK